MSRYDDDDGLTDGEAFDRLDDDLDILDEEDEDAGRDYGDEDDDRPDWLDDEDYA